MARPVESATDHTNEIAAVDSGLAPLMGKNPSESSPGAMKAVAVDTVVRL